MGNPYFTMNLDELGTVAREKCLPARTDQRRIAMSLLVKAETQEAYLEMIWDLVRLIPTDDPQFETMRRIQTLAFEGAKIWERSSTASKATSQGSE